MGGDGSSAGRGDRLEAQCLEPLLILEMTENLPTRSFYFGSMS
jgi:hypothetical protein